MQTIYRFSFYLLLALLATGCSVQAADRPISANVVEAMRAPDDANFARAYAPRTFDFPRDHGAHPEYRTEWWYYTGNLTANDGTPFGFQLTFFRSALTPKMPARASTLASNQVYMAHFALTDGGRKVHESFDRYSRGAGELAGAVGEPTYRVWLEDWRVEEIAPGVQRLVARANGEAGPVAIDLTLRETRAPVLHGIDGLHQKGPEAGNASYYYSLVGLETTGTVTSAGRTFAITGRSWMDHEFGTSALTAGAIGWDWFSVQFDNGAILMIYEIRLVDGGVNPNIKGTLIWPDGVQQMVSEDDFALTPTGTWTSPRTDITYPSGWKLTLPALDINLTITPLLADQEMDVSFVYWEGAITVTGVMRGEAVTGQGYAELTGYGAQSTTYQR
ncbi:MAG TPA: carotenoid 1,2-hydratase [Chloroflexi bacterium]|nr:carotenoid 1,2-hydratase [Chloroflexota bacterium]HHW85088.1 carotenoid 1,2-hydratase [Chloroflexota bacterium]